VKETNRSTNREDHVYKTMPWLRLIAGACRITRQKVVKLRRRRACRKTPKGISAIPDFQPLSLPASGKNRVLPKRTIFFRDRYFSCIYKRILHGANSCFEFCFSKSAIVKTKRINIKYSVFGN
jgi:hypothetical protein